MIEKIVPYEDHSQQLQEQIMKIWALVKPELAAEQEKRKIEMRSILRKNIEW